MDDLRDFSVLKTSVPFTVDGEENTAAAASASRFVCLCNQGWGGVLEDSGRMPGVTVATGSGPSKQRVKRSWASRRKQGTKDEGRFNADEDHAEEIGREKGPEMVVEKEEENEGEERKIRSGNKQLKQRNSSFFLMKREFTRKLEK